MNQESCATVSAAIGIPKCVVERGENLQPCLVESASIVIFSNVLKYLVIRNSVIFFGIANATPKAPRCPNICIFFLVEERSASLKTEARD